MECKSIKCSECDNKECASCEKIILKVIGSDDRARELYDAVLAALDKIEVDASVALIPEEESFEGSERPILARGEDLLFSGRVPSLMEILAMILLLGH